MRRVGSGVRVGESALGIGKAKGRAVKDHAVGVCEGMDSGGDEGGRTVRLAEGVGVGDGNAI